LPPEYGPSGTYPGDLITIGLDSLAPDGLFTRLLDNAKLIGLTEEQVRDLHRLSGDYHQRMMEIRLEFAVLGNRVKLTPMRLGEDGVEARKPALKRRAQLILHSEILYFEAQTIAEDLLTNKQREMLVAVFVEEKHRVLAALQLPMAYAVAPTFALAAVGTDGANTLTDIGPGATVTDEDLPDLPAEPPSMTDWAAVSGLPTEPDAAADSTAAYIPEQ
jgi:hypothetical protein